MPQESHNFWRLTEEIISLSVADTWNEARAEWALVNVFFSEDPCTCLCGHSPIKECCVLENHANGNEAIVGNVCVKKFLGLTTGPLFQALDRIKRDNTRALNATAVEFAFTKNWISNWERGFYLDTLRKRKLSPKQRAKRVQINDSVLYYLDRVLEEAAV